MNARQVKHALYARHHASGEQMPGAWTVIEEWRNIDLLAFSAWSSANNYARIGYEVKVSRADMRAELLNPGKRARNVAWCNAFYFAVPEGLLTEDEIGFTEPAWTLFDFTGERCPGFAGRACAPRFGRKKHVVWVAKPTVSPWTEHEYVVCPTCDGKGRVSEPRVLVEAPTLWVPRDVGLVTVNGRGTRLVKKAPHRKEVPALSPRELGQLIRWVSMRPDPRHYARHQRDGLREAVA